MTDGAGTMNRECGVQVESPDAIPPGRAWILLCTGSWMALGTALAWLANGRSWSGIDDANIYHVYMRNFGSGHGFVYNVGGERVEGCTSLLWTLIGSAFCRLGMQPSWPLMCVSFAALLAALVRFARLLVRCTALAAAPRQWTFVLMGGLAMTPGFLDYAVLSQLETGLYASLLLLGITGVAEQCMARRTALGGWFVAAVLLLPTCRPEGALWSLVLLLVAGLARREQGLGLRGVLAVAVAVGLSTGAITAWRMAYFGFPLPNTYYAKVSSDRIQNLIAGATYLYKCTRDVPMIALVLVLPLLALLPRSRSVLRMPDWLRTVLCCTALTTLATVFVTGGDHFRYARFIQPVMPVLLAGLLVVVAGHWPRPRWLSAIALLALLAATPHRAAVPCTSAGFRKSAIAHEWELAIRGQENSARLNELFATLEALPTQAVVTAGGQGFSYRGTTIDLMGLNSVAMAHAERRKGAYKNHGSFHLPTMLRLQPDLVWIEGRFLGVQDPVEEPWLIGRFHEDVLGKAHRQPEFLQAYELASIERAGCPWKLVIFARREFLAELREADFVTRPVAF